MREPSQRRRHLRQGPDTQRQQILPVHTKRFREWEWAGACETANPRRGNPDPPRIVRPARPKAAAPGFDEIPVHQGRCLGDGRDISDRRPRPSTCRT
jgi:hypothetical protein